MEYEWKLEDLPRVWPNIAILVGGSMLGTFVPLLWSEEKPWDMGQADYAVAMVTSARHRGSDPERHEADYTYDVGGKTYTGTYSCESMCALQGAREGGTVRVEYLLDNPARSRPAGEFTLSRLRYWRVAASIGAAVLIAGFAARVRHAGEDDSSGS